VPDVGRIGAEAEDGSSLIAAQPLWWDSSAGGTYREPGMEAPPAPVTHTMTADLLSMDVGASVRVEENRDNQAVEYPIFVDPDWSSGTTASWYTDAAYPNQSYLTAGASNVLRVGNYQQYKSDMFFQFPLGALAGKQIRGAVLNTTQVSVAACPAGPISSHFVTPLSPGYTWNQEQGWRNAGQMWWSGTMQAYAGQSGCGTVNNPIGWDVLSAIQSQAGQPNVHLAFTGDNSLSRKHFSRAATLVVNYNTPPDTPTSLAFATPTRTCGTAADPAILGGTDVTVSFSQTDPDGGNVDTNVYLHKTSDLVNAWQHRNPGLGAQGAKSVTFNGLTDGQAYAWRARGSDWIIDGASFSGWCYFTIDNTAPAAPTLASTAWAYTVGVPVGVDLSGAADVAGYEYWLAYGAPAATSPAAPVAVSRTTTLPDCAKREDGTRFACGAGAAAVRVSVAPVDAQSTLWVAAYDKAGNVSPATALKLFSADGTPAARMPGADSGHMWQTSALPSPLAQQLPDANPWLTTGALSLTAASGVGLGESDTIGGVPYPVVRIGSLSSSTDALVTAAAPLNATNSFTLSAWVKPTTVAGEQLIAVQSGSGRGRVELKLTGGKYAFCLLGAPAGDDGTKPVSGCAIAPTAAVANTWVLVTGMWDAGNQQLRLITGGTTSPVAVAPHVVGSGDWSANGPVRFGPAPDATRFIGLITNPVIVPSILDSDQMTELSFLGTPFTY